MFVTRDLWAGYGTVTVLRGADLKVEQGEFVAVLGPNGAGKTTLLRAIMGSCTVSEGTVEFEGVDLRSKAEHQRAACGVGYVPDGRHVWPTLTVLDNLRMGAVSVARTRPLQEGLDEVLQIFPQLTHRLRTRAGMLSGGEQQMLAIGRALMGRPRLLLVDEPSTGLAPIAIAGVVDALRGLHQRQGLSVLLVEQRADVASALCSRGYILNRGQVLHSDRMEALLDRVASGYFAATDTPRQ